jgi:hypothetical protein
MRWRHLRAAFYSLLRSPTRPKLLGGNLGIARADYERINGYDENFRGWGCEDDDLRMRLRDAGIRVNSIAWWTHTYHLWHPKTPSAPATWKAGANVNYLHRPLRLTRCLAGMTKRKLHDLHIQIVGTPPAPMLFNRLPHWCRAAIDQQRPRREQPEIQIAFAGSGGSFSSQCDGRVLLVPHGEAPSRAMLNQAHLVFADPDLPAARSKPYPLRDFDTVMQQQLGFSPAMSRSAAFSSAGELHSLPAAA